MTFSRGAGVHHDGDDGDYDHADGCDDGDDEDDDDDDDEDEPHWILALLHFADGEGDEDAVTGVYLNWDEMEKDCIVDDHASLCPGC